MSEKRRNPGGEESQMFAVMNRSQMRLVTIGTRKVSGCGVFRALAGLEHAL